jgi:ubiquinone/menaquinone biosynthesis C-methylase UbiE
LKDTGPESQTELHELETVKLPTQVGYDRWAEVYDAEDNPLILLEEDQIDSVIGKIAGLTVADIGCGTGRHAIRAAASGALVTAVDFSELMLERARRKPGANQITFLRHDLSQPLPLANNSFDRVLCCLVLDHIPGLMELFCEFKRICRRDGFIVVSVMHPAMNLRGVQARFIDPASGQRLSPASHAHDISDYVMAYVRAGLKLDHMSEHSVDAALAARSPRAKKYLGSPMLLLLRFGIEK